MVSSAPAALAVFAYGCLQCVGAGRAVSATALAGLGGGSDLTLALRVGTKLGTLLRAESILLPRVHDELGDSQQTLQGGCCRIGRILLEGLLEIVVEQSVGAILLVGIMEVGEHRHKLTEKCCLVLGRDLAIVGQGRNQLF